MSLPLSARAFKTASVLVVILHCPRHSRHGVSECSGISDLPNDRPYNWHCNAGACRDIWRELAPGLGRSAPLQGNFWSFTTGYPTGIRPQAGRAPFQDSQRPYRVLRGDGRLVMLR